MLITGHSSGSFQCAPAWSFSHTVSVLFDHGVEYLFCAFHSSLELLKTHAFGSQLLVLKVKR